MAWAQEMKNLAGDIRTSTRDRRRYVRDQKKATEDLLAEDRRALREMANELKNFLARSEADRKKDFETMIRGIEARVKDIFKDTHGLLGQFDREMKELASDLKDFLAKSEDARMADFRTMMKDIAETVGTIRRTTKGLLGDYRGERKEAAGYWKTLSRYAPVEVEAKTRVSTAQEAATHPRPKPKAKRRKKGKK